MNPMMGREVNSEHSLKNSFLPMLPIFFYYAVHTICISVVVKLSQIFYGNYDTHCTIVKSSHTFLCCFYQIYCDSFTEHKLCFDFIVNYIWDEICPCQLQMCKLRQKVWRKYRDEFPGNRFIVPVTFDENSLKPTAIRANLSYSAKIWSYICQASW